MAEGIMLEARGVTLEEAARPIDLAVARGEIVGLAGLEGHGQEAFIETLCGLHRPVDGTVTIRTEVGREAPVTSLAEAVRLGVAYLPRDRRGTGIFPGQSVFDNFAIAALPRHATLGVVRRRGLLQRLRDFRERLSMVYDRPDAPIGTLSGGNQQKVLLARWLACEPRVMLLNDPTRGVDLGTRMKLYDTFRGLARNEGMPLVVLSTEIEEILQLCDRVLVFRERAVSRELGPDELAMDRVIAAMFGQGEAA
ncbi:MAG: sugar ABC transporter ATP-binding protein [Geminicoccaceae bacterium]|jgi:ribose transport system ATP-binding protein|nr:sugar ABC transporter ATP-binding protein [Geminicoccaceae bacterium]MCB9966018.1 sugar ABC transporter ATP-binding protein [Geminicoccaceae bacterium]HRY24464.1 ATP-binding cassette domain-containing protein [Geminicoccaceae bacterium]